MLPRLLAPALLSLAMIQGAAFGMDQNSNSSMSSTTGVSKDNTGTAQTAQSLPQEMKQKLQSEGFTDVKVVPGSYIISAKDKEGDPVTAIIGPHSLTVFSQVSSDKNETTGSNGEPANSPKSK